MSHEEEDDGHMEEYFDAYVDASVHQTMLEDVARNDAYRQALEAFGATGLTDKVVLDVGAGTGILSMLAARCGARHVYAVEASPVAKIARRIAAANGFSDRITVLEGKAEDVQLPCQVDVIVSEWMGFYLLHESMLPSVLAARDAWLKPDGVMLPGVATLWAAPADMSELVQRRMGFWGDVCGFDLSPMQPLAAKHLLSRPEVTILRPEQIVGAAAPALVLDLHTATEQEIDVVLHAGPSRLTRQGAAHGIATWFDTHFTTSRAAAAAATAAVKDGRAPGRCVTLSTSPASKPTHWKQTVFLVEEAYGAAEGATLPVALLMARDEGNPRLYEAHPRLGEEVPELVPQYRNAKQRAQVLRQLRGAALAGGAEGAGGAQ